MMKTIEFERYGPPEVLQLKETEKPIPGADEVLIRIHATTVTATECTFRKGKPLAARLFTGLTRPKLKRLGEELAGEVEAVGKNVTRFMVGDVVFGTAGDSFGACAEYVSLSEDAALVAKPSEVPFAEAAAVVDGFLTALPFLRDSGHIREGQRVLIIGASGAVGSAAVQLAHYFGAEVTGVCSTTNVELVKSVGADTVIDYTKEDFTQTGKTWDIIFDAVGKTSFSRCRKALNPTGIFLEAGMVGGILPWTLWTSLWGRKKAKIAFTGLRSPEDKAKDLLLLKRLLENGAYKPVIDRSYPLEEAVDAHRYVETGHKKGSVVLDVRS